MYILSLICSRISGVMVSVHFSSEEDRGFKPRLDQTKDYKIAICCFSAKHAALRIKCNDWLARNQNNVTECGDMSISRLLFGPHHHLIENLLVLAII